MLTQVQLLQNAPESAVATRQTGVLGANIQSQSSGRPPSTTVECSDSIHESLPPTVPADSNAEDVPSAADGVTSSHVLASELQHSDSLWTKTLPEAAAAALMSPASTLYVSSLRHLSPVPLLDSIMQPNVASIVEQPFQGPENTSEQEGSNDDSIGTAISRQSGIKVCTIPQYGSGLCGCSSMSQGSVHALLCFHHFAHAPKIWEGHSAGQPAYQVHRLHVFQWLFFISMIPLIVTHMANQVTV